MSCEHIDHVLEHSCQKGSCLLVLVIIAFYSDQNGEWTIDQATLQRLARLGGRRIQQILRRLAEAGELAVVSHFGRGKLSTYRLLVEEEAPPAAQQRPPESRFGKMDYTVYPQPSDRYISSNERLTKNLPN